MYRSSQPTKSGVPLGGFGTGKIEIFPNGTLDGFTIQNNWSSPLANAVPFTKASVSPYPEGLIGFHFGLAFGPQLRQTLLLQTVPIRGYRSVRRIRYQGRYPCADLVYEDPRLPVKVLLSACAPMIPGDPEASAWPAASFRFTFLNARAKARRVSLLMLARNIIGYDAIGRYNTVQRHDGLVSLRFQSRHQLAGDTRYGEMAVSVAQGAGDVSALAGWNLQTEDFRLDRFSTMLEPLRYFRGGAGRLPDQTRCRPIEGGGAQLAGALAVTVSVPPRGRREVPVSLAWHFPAHHTGHWYERRFRSVTAVARTFHRQMPRLQRRTTQWQKEALRLALPVWLRDALLNNLYPLTSASIWSRKGEFALLEAPQDCPLVGTLDVAFYGSLPVTLFFPSLDRVWLELLARAQRPNGYVPHDLGRDCFDAPSNGTTNFYWKDLAPKFALMVYRHYLWTGNRRFLARMFPVIARAMQFCRSCDRDGDGLPENEGADQTFDMWRFRGINVYTAGVVLAALLAYQRMAMLTGNAQQARGAERWFAKASATFEARLWNGRYFIACAGAQGRYEACMTAQLVGQWAAHLLGLGYIVDARKVRIAVRTLLTQNATASRFGAPNALRPDGRLDRVSRHAQTIWPGQCYALSALAIYEGFAREGLALARRTWETFATYHRNPWNQPDVLFPDDGRYGFGDAYMRNMVIWAIPIALARRSRRLANGLRRVCAPARTRVS